MFSVAHKHWLQIFLVQLSFLVLQANSRGVCPNNWQHIQGSCFKFSSQRATWNSAKSACEALGSKLAMVKSQAIQQALASKTNFDAWIGLHRDAKDRSRWVWVDGTKLAYHKWNPREPNDAGNNEGCAQMIPGQGWNDIPCSKAFLRYICETFANCLKLSLKSGVRVSPSSCLSSNQVYGSTCSFSCARGYRLNGPSLTQCGKGGVWSRNVNTVSCNDVRCPALAVNQLVKTSPNSCVTSQMKYNTKCSFKCPLGFILKGPSYTQCGSNGRWTNSAKRVSCTASGVHVKCNSNNMTITIPKSLARGLDRKHLRLLDSTCRATESKSHYSLTTPLTGCNTTRRHNATTMVYSNAVLEIPGDPKYVVTHVHEIKIHFSCLFSKYGVVSSVGWKLNNRKLVFSEGQGNFSLSLNLFPDKTFVSPYTANDFPVLLHKILFFEVSVTSSDKQLSIIADRCFATPTQNRNNSLKYEFITKGCPGDVTVKHHSAPSASSQRYSMKAFKFIANHPFVFIHCHVIICNASNPGSRCAKKCPPSGRGRRDVGDHMTDDIYNLAQGPIFLAPESRREHSERTRDKKGFGPVAIVLFVMCAACLVGTALMALKKSRDKPVGYTVLVTADKE